jgi:hypothetical protein
MALVDHPALFKFNGSRRPGRGMSDDADQAPEGADDANGLGVSGHDKASRFDACNMTWRSLPPSNAGKDTHVLC